MSWFKANYSSQIVGKLFRMTFTCNGISNCVLFKGRGKELRKWNNLFCYVFVYNFLMKFFLVFYLRPCQTVHAKHLYGKKYGLNTVDFFAKSFIVDVWQDLKCVSPNPSAKVSRIKLLLNSKIIRVLTFLNVSETCNRKNMFSGISIFLVIVVVIWNKTKSTFDVP